MIEFVSQSVVVNSLLTNKIELTLTKTDVSMSPVSLNVILSGADSLAPAAQQYNGVKISVVWAVAETGNKTIVIPIEPTANPEEYLQASIDDILGDTVGDKSSVYILIAKGDVDAATKFLPSVPGKYIQTLNVNNFTNSFVYEGFDQLNLTPFEPNTATQSGKAGLVPAPPAIPYPQILSSQGWEVSSIPGIEQRLATIENQEIPVIKNRLTSAEDGIAALDGRLDVVEQTSIPEIKTRLTSTESGIAALDGRLDVIEQTEIPGIKTRLTSAETGITALDARLDVVEQTEIPGIKTRLDAIEQTEIPGIKNDITALDGRLDAIEQTEIPGIKNRLTSAETGIAALDGRLDVVEQTEIPGIKTRLNNIEQVALPEVDSRLTQIEQVSVPGLQTQITNLQQPFVPNTPNAAGASGLVPAPSAGVTKILTSAGWTEAPTIPTPQDGADGKTLVNVEYVQRLIAELEKKIEPIGTIKLWSHPTLPGADWEWCLGGELSRLEYAELFTLIGTYYGNGDGVNTFNLPQTADRVFVGTGASYSLGQSGGEKTHTLTQAEMPVHTHDADPHNHPVANDVHAHQVPGRMAYAGGDTHSWDLGSSESNSVFADNVWTTANSTNISISASDVNINATGGSQPFNVMQPFVAVNFVIKIR